MKYTTVDAVKAILGIVDGSQDARIDDIIEAVSEFITKDCGRTNLEIHSEFEIFDVLKGARRFFPKQKPIVSITTAEIFLKGVKESDYLDHIYAYNEYFEAEVPFSFRRPQALKITFESGFFAFGSVPKDLDNLTAKMSAEEFKKQALIVKTGIKSEKIGRYAIEYSAEDFKKTEATDYNSVVSHYKETLKFSSF